MTAATFLPEKRNLRSLTDAAATCQGCDLYKNATQTVFGEGPARAPIVLIGEVPGDREDREGHPFIGPAGGLLDEALREARIGRKDVYVTNAVKHFKWEPRGNRRLHKKPSARELKACRPWLDAELDVIKPDVVVCLGATAAQQLFGRDFRITKQRGEWLKSEACESTIATWHPSAVLRVPDESARDQMREQLVADLKKAARRLVG